MPLSHHALEARGVLARKVRGECRSGRSGSREASGRRVARRHCLGVRSSDTGSGERFRRPPVSVAAVGRASFPDRRRRSAWFLTGASWLTRTPAPAPASPHNRSASPRSPIPLAVVPAPLPPAPGRPGRTRRREDRFRARPPAHQNRPSRNRSTVASRSRGRRAAVSSIHPCTSDPLDPT